MRIDDCVISSHCVRYEMTPVRTKSRKSESVENYGINDIQSDDSTDDEDQPRKAPPAWATGECNWIPSGMINVWSYFDCWYSVLTTILFPTCREPVERLAHQPVLSAAWSGRDIRCRDTAWSEWDVCEEAYSLQQAYQLGRVELAYSEAIRCAAQLETTGALVLLSSELQSVYSTVLCGLNSFADVIV